MTLLFLRGVQRDPADVLRTIAGEIRDMRLPVRIVLSDEEDAVRVALSVQEVGAVVEAARQGGNEANDILQVLVGPLDASSGELVRRLTDRMAITGPASSFAAADVVAVQENRREKTWRLALGVFFGCFVAIVLIYAGGGARF
jgi:hypothetical protein